MQSITQLSDAELVTAFAQGNERALETLILRHKDRVYTAVYMLVKDHYLAEDIFQDVFLKAVTVIRDGRYSEQGKFLPWIVRIAHNMCMDHFRKVKRPIPIVLEDGRELGELIAVHNEDPETKMEQRQTHATVRELVEHLPEEQREVVVLRVFGGLSFKEIARLTSVSINTALGRMRYALINLRRMIDDRQLVLR